MRRRAAAPYVDAALVLALGACGPSGPEPARAVSSSASSPAPAPAPKVGVEAPTQAASAAGEALEVAPRIPSLAAYAPVILRTSGFMTRDWEETPRLALRVTFGVDDSLRATFKEFNVGAGFTFNDHVQRLSDERAASLGLTRPESAWLFTADGPCRASIGAPYILAYEHGPEVIELGYMIDLCGSDEPSAPASQRPFAPLALLAGEAPKAKWIAVERGNSTAVEGPWSAWTHPRRATFEELGALAWTPDGGESRTPVLHVRERSAGARVAELGFAWHWPGRECHEREEMTLRVGTWAGERFEPLPAFDGANAHGALVGVLATDEAPLVVIGRLDHQMYLAPWQGERFGPWEERRVFGYPVDDEERRDVLWSVLEHECVL